MRLLLAGLGIGVGLGVWSLISILAWKYYAGETSGAGDAAPRFGISGPGVADPGAPPELKPSAEGSDLTVAVPKRAEQIAQRSSLGDVPNELRSAPEEWIMEKIPLSAKSAFQARLSFTPPGIRIEECFAKSSAEEPCKLIVAGSVMSLTADSVTLRPLGDGDPVTVGWKISGGRLTLMHAKREFRFRPGTKAELLKLLNGAGGGT